MSTSKAYVAAAAVAHRLQVALLTMWRRAVVLLARDDTTGSATRSCLVIAPHPDDETIGCGATIAAKRAHLTPVTVVIVADGRHAQSNSRLVDAERLAKIRSEEVVAACEALGVDRGHVLQLGYEDTHVDEREDSLVDELSEIISSVDPDELLVISRHDHHPDHRAVNRATYRALARLDHQARVSEFPVWSWIDGPWLDQRARSPVGRALNLFAAPLRTIAGGRPTVVSTTGVLDEKQAALAAHASQTTPYTDEPEWAVMDEPMLEPFVGDFEVFLPGRNASAGRQEQGRICGDRVAPVGGGADAGPGVLVDDEFSDPVAPGHVIGSRATNGARRLGSDRHSTLSVDNGQLRVGWMEYPDWGDSAIAYGPFRAEEPLVLSVRVLNGLTTSQSDWRPEGRRALLQRLRATLPRGPVRRPEIRENMVVGWFRQERPKRGDEPVAAVFHRAGDAQIGELWFQAGANRVMLCDGLQNIPANLVVTLRDGMAVLNAWSYPAAHCYAEPGDLTPLAALSVGPVPERLYAVVHQPILGEVFYRVDTRIDRVQVLAPGDALESTLERLSEHRWWDPRTGPVCFEDHFVGPARELDHVVPEGSLRWERLLGEGVFELSGSGGARVRASRSRPNPGRTIYGVPWSDTRGANLSMEVTPPGTARGQGHRGRSGVAFWQDEDNHFIVNTWIDDAMVGVSLSAFLRLGGREKMFEWDAVWTNVGSRISHGVPFVLSVSCDGTQFLCRLDGEPVMYRAFSDYRAEYRGLRIGHVGMVANWEWGDDTGSRLGHFTARPLDGPGTGS